MNDNYWVVYWKEYTSDTYLFGSTINYHSKTDIEFENMLMPPGTVIKQWYSQTHFQLQKIEPALPIIDGESKYQIIVNMENEPNETFLFRLVFYDRYENEAGFINIRNTVTEFQCPLKTYSYRLQMINSGMTHFHFHSIIIRDITNESEGNTEEIK